MLGAAMMATGRPAVEAVFDQVASQFSDCSSFAIEVIAAGASDDFAYLVAFEHTTAAIAGDDPAPYTLRVTTVFRREGDAWKAVHRHADHLADGRSAGERLAALRAHRGAHPS